MCGMLCGQPRIAGSMEVQAHHTIIHVAEELINRIGATI
jgi:hypothetical protein